MSPYARISRYGLYFSVLLFFYGTLFPFQFDLSPQSLSLAWSKAGILPFWDMVRGRIHSLPDMMANGLLTVPLGFFGVMVFGFEGYERRKWGIAGWFVLGFALGIFSEMIQLAIPSRISDITDSFINGLGAIAGAVIATLFGKSIIDFLAGSILERRITLYWILAGIITACMLLPFDLSLDVGHFRAGLKTLLVNPWESSVPIESEWIRTAEFALLGALAVLIRRVRLILFTLALPFFLEAAQLLVDSHAPSLRDLAMNVAGAAAGLTVGKYAPALIRPSAGFILINLAIVAQGLSPYRFVDWAARSHFEWIPLVEYYNRTTGAALHDALSGLLTYALLAALWPRRAVILWAVLLAGGIETAQVFIINRFAGITDILIASIGAWLGHAYAWRGPYLRFARPDGRA